MVVVRRSAMVLMTVINCWSGSWCQSVPGSGPCRCSRCCLRTLCTRCAVQCSGSGWWTAAPPAVASTEGAAACRSRGNTAGGSRRWCRGTWSPRFYRHPLLSGRTERNDTHLYWDLNWQQKQKETHTHTQKDSVYLVGAEERDHIGLHLGLSLFRDAFIWGRRLNTEDKWGC